MHEKNKWNVMEIIILIIFMITFALLVLVSVKSMHLYDYRPRECIPSVQEQIKEEALIL